MWDFDWDFVWDFSKFSKCANFFVFQSYGLRFSGRRLLALKRSFPVSFVFAVALRGVCYRSFGLLKIKHFISKKSNIFTMFDF